MKFTPWFSLEDRTSRTIIPCWIAVLVRSPAVDCTSRTIFGPIPRWIQFFFVWIHDSDLQAAKRYKLACLHRLIVTLCWGNGKRVLLPFLFCFILLRKYFYYYYFFSTIWKVVFVVCTKEFSRTQEYLHNLFGPTLLD